MFLTAGMLLQPQGSCKCLWIFRTPCPSCMEVFWILFWLQPWVSDAHSPSWWKLPFLFAIDFPKYMCLCVSVWWICLPFFFFPFLNYFVSFPSCFSFFGQLPAFGVLGLCIQQENIFFLINYKGNCHLLGVECESSPSLAVAHLQPEIFYLFLHFQPLF